MATSPHYTELIPPTHLGSLGYQKFTIFKDQKLGRGSYGTVYKAEYDDLPCAAKVLHPTLVDNSRGGVMQRFEQECQVLSKIKHPNIVLYLGLRTDPASQLPVLLMELLDESLTRMLKQSQHTLPYCVQVDICYHIALALSYLHSHKIIHRDLSGNNVLITAKRIAKVTDFGMSCITDDLGHKRLTSCPGTEVYMPPEALNDLPTYSKALDMFSFGVIIIQVLTRLVPSPSPQRKEATNFSQLHPRGLYMVIVPEHERRQEHIRLVDPPLHPLLKLALLCIRDNPDIRPEASDLCKSFKELKQSPLFMESKQQGEGDTTHKANSLLANNGAKLEDTRLLDERDRKISSLHKQLSEQEILLTKHHFDRKEKQAALNKLAHEAQHLQEMNRWLTTELQQKEGELKEASSFPVKESMRASDKKIAHLQETNRLIMEEKRRESGEKDALLSVKEAEIISLNEKLHESEKQIADFQTAVYNLQEQLRKLQPQQKQQSHIIVPEVQLKCQIKAPISIHRGASAVHNNMAYFMFRKTVIAYDMNLKVWKTLVECPQANGGFTIVGESPTMVGGLKGEQATNELVSFIDGLWIETLPRMPTPRIYSSAVTFQNHLIVAGGSSTARLGVDILPVVEVVDISNCQTEQPWSTLCSLPHPLADASVVVNKGQMIMLGGTDRIGKTLINLTCDLSKLLKSLNKTCARNPKGAKNIGMKLKRALDSNSKRERESTPPSVWVRLGDSREYYSTCVSIGNQLLAVGGCGLQGTSTGYRATVDRYNFNNSTWEHIGSLTTTRWLCHAVGISDSEIMVVGGFQVINGGDHILSDQVEISTIYSL